MKDKALGEGNKEVIYTSTQMLELSKPTWTNGWTRLLITNDKQH